MANLAGYPAINVVHGFLESGSPASLTIYGPPFRETEVIALARAYEAVSGFHGKHPNLDAVTPTQKSS